MVRAILITILLLFAGILLTGADSAEAALCETPGAHGQCTAPLPPPTFSTPPPRAGSILDGVTYGWIEDYARFYERPDLESRRTHYASTGVFYGPVDDTATGSDGEEWLKVWDHWLPAEKYHRVEASTFSGVRINAQPQRPFGWVLHPFQPRPEPGAQAEPDTPELPRYEFVEVYGTQVGSDGAMWHDIGGGQWIRYHAVALQMVRERPRGVDEHEYWVDVDLWQQTLAAYEGDRIVFASIISSGLPRWPTRHGLFRVYARHLTTPMSGGEVGDDYYRLADVPHTLYYDKAIALHGAYWHDDFGRPKSHGCVNIPPRAAEWLYFWSENAPGDLRVWVHSSTYADFLY
ncbi:MAG TPA: L,D-transpeptidase [Candidatus Sulfomarinibacteraceae bacterium]|nr:L,D-transpeptidase [Candidatus Sulfomarinibacteraceae bacterium]